MCSAEAHKTQMARLRDLLKVKAQIENHMEEKLAELRRNFVLQSEAIESALERRLEQMK